MQPALRELPLQLSGGQRLWGAERRDGRDECCRAVGAAVGPVHIGLQVLESAGGGALVGAVFAVTIGFLHKRTTDPLVDNAVSLLTPFVVTAAAEYATDSPEPDAAELYTDVLA